MVFTTQIFLFLFFPISLLAFTIVNKLAGMKNTFGKFLVKIRAQELIIITLSLAFYGWTNMENILQLLVYILLVYVLAKWLEYSVAQKKYVEIKHGLPEEEGIGGKRFYLSRIACAIAIVIVLSFLVAYKYLSMIFGLLNRLFTIEFSMGSLIAPLGISFITFSAISYLVDVYKQKATAGSFIDCALYISFFPKIISGPIVLWRNFQGQIGSFSCTLEQSIEGINRIIIGFAKKVILADMFGKCLVSIGVVNIDWLTAVGALVLYMLQIYYDFAGYSDIAIGLSKLFGLHFNNNFNFPYRSKSITEFWRRWHISLGAWFREYVYIPLGGNRKGLKRTLINLGIVFLLTGIWHGVGKNYLIWGGINAFFVILERVIKGKRFYQKIPDFIKYICTMLIIIIFWLFFRFESLEQVVDFMKVLLGITKFSKIPYTWQYFYDAQMLTLMVVGILGATVFGGEKVKALYSKFVETKVGYIVQEVLLLALFVLAILFMVNSTYSPFIYFQY